MVEFKVGLIFSNFDKLTKMQTSLANQLKTTEKTNAQYDKMSMKLANINTKLAEVSKRRSAFSTLISGTQLEMFEKYNSKFTKFNEAFKTIGGKKGFNTGLGDFFKNFGKQSTGFATNLKSLFGGGISGMIKTITTALSGLTAGFSGFLAILGSVALPITLIVAGIFLMSRVWKQNIGGMQTTFYKTFGVIKDFFASAMVSIDKSLRKLAPVFKIIFGFLYMHIRPVLAVIIGLFKGVMAIVDALATSVGEMVKPFAKMFGGTGQAKGFESVMKGITKTFEVLGTIIGWVVKIALFPLVLTFRALAWLFGLIGKGISWVVSKFMGLKIVQDLIGKIHDRWELFMKGIRWFLDKVGAIKKAFDTVFGDKDKDKEVAIKRTETLKTASNLTTNKSTTVNNNQQFAVHSASSITPNNANAILDSVKGNVYAGQRGG